MAKRVSVRVAAVIAVAACVCIGPARAAQAQNVCTAEVNGRPIAEFGDPETPLEVDVDEDIVVRALAPADASRVLVEVVFPFVNRIVVDEAVTPGSVFEEVVDLEDIARVGVGLYRIDVEAGSCTQPVWVRIGGGSPFTRPVGVAATLLLLIGVILVVTAAVGAGGGKRRIVRGAFGGGFMGLGALVLAQQLGWVGLTDRILLTWIGFPAVAGAGITQVASMFSGAGAAVPPASPGPAPFPPAPGPPPAPPSPPAPAPPPAPPTPPPSAPPPVPEPPVPSWSAPPTSSAADPPRTAYARMDAPDAVVAGEAFTLVVGLAPEPMPGVVGGPLVRPATSVGPYTLIVQVVADGFTLAEEGGWRRELAVTADAPYPLVFYTLVAETQPGQVWSRPIQALFSVDGQTMGMAVRALAVVGDADLLHQMAPSTQDPTAVMTVSTQADPADLTVRILRGSSASDGRLLWTFETAHGVAVPDEQVTTDIGDRPEVFTSQLIAGVASHRGRATLLPFLTGVGRTIAEQVPPELHQLLQDIAPRLSGRPPRVLLLSAEPHVPWELATLEPPLDPSVPPFLGAQADVGRWVLGHRRPSLPPPLGVDVADVAVVTGVYPRAEWRLVDAEEEAAAIVDTWRGVPVDAVATSVLACLGGTPPADILHFAVHGTYAPEGLLEGLILVDGGTLDPMAVQGSTLGRSAFVFLNACQVGSGNTVLGDYAGLAKAFLSAGASAVVAPLWSIDDEAAKQLALRFYRRALDDGMPPAAVLRDERRSYAAADADGAATRLAYQYFGHPALALRRSD